MGRTLSEKTQDRLFLLKTIKEILIPDPATLEKVILTIQLILLGENRPRVFSYHFYKSRLGTSEKNLFNDLKDLYRAEFIEFVYQDSNDIEYIRITQTGIDFLTEFSDLLKIKDLNNFNIALESLKKINLKNIEYFIQENRLILSTDIGKYVFA